MIKAIRFFNGLGKASPLMQRRWQIFCQHKRGFYALWLFWLLFGLSLLSNILANDKPLLIWCGSANVYSPALKFYPEVAFGGQFRTEPLYSEPYFTQLMQQNNCRMVWAPLPFSATTIDAQEEHPAPAPPSWRHLFGTDERQRDVVARLLYGFRLSVTFAVLLTAMAAGIGLIMGAVMGYFGGLVDLSLQRFVEVWNAVPSLYVLLIASSLISPGFTTLLLLSVLFQWTGVVGLVRAEFMRLRNFDYIRAARARGVSNIGIMTTHILPNALAVLLAYVPFMICAGITSLAALDFLGLGLPIGTASLGDLIVQARNNLQAPWLAAVACVATGGTLMLLLFIGDALRDAFDPKVTP